MAETYKPPAGVKAAGQRALAWIKEGKQGSGFTATGRYRAEQLASGIGVTWDTVQRMRNFLGRHVGDKKAEGFNSGEDGYPSPGRVAWDAWGGDAGATWVNQMKFDPKNKPTMSSESKHYSSSKPAPKKDQIKGSDKNKAGSASSSKNSIALNAATKTGLENKVKTHNADMSKAGKPASTRATYGALAAVYRRGAGAFSTSFRPGQTRGSWAMARVNAFLYLLRNGRPKNAGYVTDNDLLPSGHPKSSK